MDLSRRDLALAALMAPFLAQQAAAQSPAGIEAPPGPAPVTAAHDMSAMPAHWIGKEEIAFLIYPQFTALDMVGPHYMFTSLMGAKVHVVAKTLAPVTSDAGLTFTPTTSLADCPAQLDIICVPGGTLGTLAAMQDDETLRFLKDRGSRARFVTSVCTGSLLLGAAGLLEGYRATSHWVAKPLLPMFGAVPAEGRVVQDRNRITGAGVTAGIDFGLSLVGALRDRTYAEAVQLMAEYAPEPPYDAGTPARAPAKVKQILDDMMTDFLVEAQTVGKAAFTNARSL